MKGITIKLPEATLRRLDAEARATGQSIAAVVRSKLERQEKEDGSSVHAVAADLAGTLAGKHRSATNDRPKFRRP